MNHRIMELEEAIKAWRNFINERTTLIDQKYDEIDKLQEELSMGYENERLLLKYLREEKGE